MRWAALANFPMRGISVQNEPGDVRPGVFHMELFTKYENRKSWLWQLPIFIENPTIGKLEYKIADIDSDKGERPTQIVIGKPGS